MHNFTFVFNRTVTTLIMKDAAIHGVTCSMLLIKKILTNSATWSVLLESYVALEHFYELKI